MSCPHIPKILNEEEILILKNDNALRRYKVRRGWILIQKFCEKPTETYEKYRGDTLTAVGVFIADPNHEWEIE